MANSKWTYPELVLALDFYFNFDGVPPNQASPEVVRLSEQIRSLNPGVQKGSFRNPNGCYMKWMNFRHFDDRFGSGFGNTARADQVIWDLYSNNMGDLSIEARAIREGLSVVGAVAEQREYCEGAISERLHKYRERNKSAVIDKKAQVLVATGTLECEACGFNYHHTYGKRQRVY